MKKGATKAEQLKAVPAKQALRNGVFWGLGAMAIPVTSSIWNGMWAENGLFLVQVFGGTGAVVGAGWVLLPWVARFLDFDDDLWDDHLGDDDDSP